MAQARQSPPLSNPFPPTRVVFLIGGDVMFEVCEGKVLWGVAGGQIRAAAPLRDESCRVLREWLEDALKEVTR